MLAESRTVHDFFFDLIKLFFDDSNIFLIFGKTVVR